MNFTLPDRFHITTCPNKSAELTLTKLPFSIWYGTNCL